jgi:hypothetical protein
MTRVSYIFNTLEINKYTVQKCVYIVNVNVQYIHTLQVCMSISGTVIYYTGQVYQSPNPPGTHRFKWEFCDSIYAILVCVNFFRKVTLA